MEFANTIFDHYGIGIIFIIHLLFGVLLARVAHKYDLWRLNWFIVVYVVLFSLPVCYLAMIAYAKQKKTE